MWLANKLKLFKNYFFFAQSCANVFLLVLQRTTSPEVVR